MVVVSSLVLDEDGVVLQGTPAHLEAAKTVAAETWGLAIIPVYIYRTMEFTSNFVLVAGLWCLVYPLVVLVPFVFLWYLPATIRARSIFAPLTYPIMLFVVDDFSLLTLHPTPRSARSMYITAIIRVLLMLTIPAIATWSALPESFKSVIAYTSPSSLPPPGTVTENYKRFVPILWEVFGVVVLWISVLWVVITIAMLIATAFWRDLRVSRSLRGELDTSLLSNVSGLARDIHKASEQAPKDCYHYLEAVHEKRPKFKPKGFLAAWMPLCMIIAQTVFDIYNTMTLAIVPDDVTSHVMAMLLGLTVVVTLIFMSARMHWRPWRIFYAAHLTQQRGLFTPDYLSVVRCGKGVQAVLALGIQIFKVPFAARALHSVLIGVVAIVLKIFSIASFVHDEFDLGTEVEGKVSNHARRYQFKDTGAASAPKQCRTYPSYGALSATAGASSPKRREEASGGDGARTERPPPTAAGTAARDSAPTVNQVPAPGVGRDGQPNLYMCRFCRGVYSDLANYCPMCGRSQRGAFFLNGTNQLVSD